MHHYGCVALYEASILQKGQLLAASLASSSSMSKKVRSPLMFLSQVERGRPGVLLQSSGGGLNSIQFACTSPSIRAICPNNERCLLLTMEESGGCLVMRHISSFLTKSCQQISEFVFTQQSLQPKLSRWCYASVLYARVQ